VCTGRDSLVGIATNYGQVGTEIESRQGQNFSHSSRYHLAHKTPIQWVRGLSRMYIRRGAALIIQDVKEREELYLCFTYGLCVLL
jgi:hypothetical protein